MSEFDRNPQIDPNTFKPVTASPNKFKHKVGAAASPSSQEPECTICHANATEGKRYSFIMSHNAAAEGQDPAITRFMANNKTMTLCPHCNNRLSSAGTMNKYLSNLKNQGKIT